MTTLQQAVNDARRRFGISEHLPEILPETIVELLSAAVARSPESPAFSALGGTLSYRQVDELSNNFAAYLQKHTNLIPGDRIAIQLPNLLQYPVVAFGAIKAGLIVVNTNPLYTPRELINQLGDSGAKAAVVLDSLIHNLKEALPQTDITTVISTGAADLLGDSRRLVLNALIKIAGKGRKVSTLSEEVSFKKALQLGGKSHYSPVEIKQTDIALLQYTGGTTGVAKGAELTHHNLVCNTFQVMEILKHCGLKATEEQIIAPLPLYHVFSFVVSMVMMVHIRGHIHLIPDPRNIPSLVKVLKNTKATVFFGLNTLFTALMRHKGFRDVDFSGLKLTAAGGMALSESVALEWQKITGCPITEGYGLTETSPVVAVNVPGHEKLGTIGIAVPDTEVRIVDESGVDQGIDGSGELWVRGPQVMRGYWSESLELADSPDSEGWFHTGDIACVGEDGRLRILDRKKDMIIVSGFNVYPNEIENVFNGHPDIKECAAIGVPDQLTGEAIKLYVVLNGKDLDTTELKDWSRNYLTAYKIPRHYEFCKDLPKSNVGKVLRARLREAS